MEPATVTNSHLPSGLASRARGVLSSGIRAISLPSIRSTITRAAAPCCWEPTNAVRPSGANAALWGCATGMRLSTVSVAVSITMAWLAPKAETRTRRPSREMARPCGFGPTSTLPTTRLDAVSITLTVEAPSLLT